MRAVAFSVFGGPDVLEVHDLPLPVPGRGQVRVRVHAAAVNPTDTVFRSGQLYAAAVRRPPPWVPGMDFAGTVDLGGPGSIWPEGARVMGVAVPSGARQGAYADYVVVADESIVEVPPGVDTVDACTLPMNGLTALRALDGMEEMLEGRLTLGVTGAAGGVGGLFVEMAKAKGHRIVADAADGDVVHVKGRGADLVLPRGPQWPTSVRACGGVDGLLDAGVTGADAVTALKPRGVLALVRPSDTPPPDELRVLDVRMTDYYRHHAKLRQLASWLAGGVLTPRVAEVFAPEQAARAHRQLAQGGVRGRLVLRFSDEPAGVG